MKNKIQKILKENKIIIVIILISLFPIYFGVVYPYQVRKQCSQTTVSNYSGDSLNPEYNEVAERQKEKTLGKYIQCRNDNLLEGDQVYINKNSSTPHQFSQTEYDTLSLEQLDKLTLGGLDSSYFYAYDGHIIDSSSYRDLKENKDKYPQCDFPQDRLEKYLSGYWSSYSKNASDYEYKTCLRKNGL